MAELHVAARIVEQDRIPFDQAVLHSTQPAQREPLVVIGRGTDVDEAAAGREQGDALAAYRLGQRAHDDVQAAVGTRAAHVVDEVERLERGNDLDAERLEHLP